MSAGNLVRRPRVAALIVVALSAVIALAGSVAAALGAAVTGVAVTGGAGTVTVGNALHAKKDATVTITVTTSPDTECVEIKGAHTAVQTAPKGQDRWTFTFTAGAGNGVQTMTVDARGTNNKGDCNSKPDTRPASYVLDNTGPDVKGTVSPAPNAAGWSNADPTVTWAATDLSGVASGPTPASATQTTPTAGTDLTARATDALGNTASGRVTVKLDKTLPSIDATRSPAPNAAGWNRTDVSVGFTCADALSGIKSCTGGGTVTVATEGADQRVPGTAVDNADNVNDAGVSAINIDKTAPALRGTPREQPNAAGWYRDDVAIGWTASDALSGLAGTVPADSSVGGEGTGLTASASVDDRAGNRTTASSAAVRIDRTPPATSATAPEGWSRGDVAITLHPADALSGVATTSYQVDGGPVRSGTAVAITGDGRHTLRYWSTDAAGNVEPAISVEVDIDATAPRIRHELDRTANANNWFREDVAVDFICEDATAGIASCGPDAVVAEEAAGRQVAGRAVDGAGNTADDLVSISLDKTAPTVAASADRAPDAAGWYRDDVTVRFVCGDTLSGVDRCPAAQVLGEGRGQSASGTASDAAGNAASASASGIDVDKTAPVLSGEATPGPNAAGWNAGDVTVAWTCSDALSGLDGDCPASQVVRGEGSDLSASASVRDRAGNAAHRTVDGIRIDRTAPSTTASVDEALGSGWYAAAANVELRAADALSGVAATHFRIDDGPVQEYAGPFAVTEKGRHTVTFWSTDKAGNVEDRTAAGHAIEIKIDGIPPRIEGTASPAANAFGWNNTDVTVSFLCSDDESGMDLASGVEGCDPGTTFAAEGTDLAYEGTARDVAGNTASATVSGINIDKTPPALTGAATSPANAAGWHRGDVTVAWTGQDALSEIDTARHPDDTVVTGEGDALVAGPVTTWDKAGNESAAASVGPIRIDRTAPRVTGAPTAQPNEAGWYRGAVRVAFTCTDNLSGCAGRVSDELLDQDGADQAVTSAPADDAAGNRTAGTRVGGISIDSKAPSSSAAQRCDGSNGYCKGRTATVVLTADDQPGLSGVQELRYAIDGGAEQTVAGAEAVVEVPLAAGSGRATLAYRAVDRAGNAEVAKEVELRYDNLAPTVTHTVDPAANAAGWNRAPLTVSFDAVDDDGGSGVDRATLTPDVRVSDETDAAGRRVEGQAADLAGNVGSDAVTVKLDRTAPAITATVTGPQGADGWYTGAVTVRFTCTDGLSTVATCSKEELVTTNGANQSVVGEAEDRAGNTARYEVTGLNIDSTKPTIEMTGVAAGGQYLLGAAPKAGCTAKDNISTSVSCEVQVTGGTANGVGTFSYTATATDGAGNTATETGTYSVIYRWSGVLQPINDTGHDPGSAPSVFKAGSTVPTKFVLRRADGSPVQAGSPPVWLTPSKGTAITAAIDESVFSTTPSAGGLFKYDAASGQYHYNWGTPRGVANYYRLGISLDDGQRYYVNVGLR